MTIVVSEVNAEVRFKLGGLTTDQLSDTVLDQIINDCIIKIGDADEFFCEVTYCSIIDALRYMIRRDQGGNAGASGDVKRRKEINGKRQIEVEYSSTNSVTTGWQAVLDEFLADPSLVCDELIKNPVQGVVLIGGVSQTEYDRVDCLPDSRNGYQLNVNSKYNRGVTKYNKSKWWR